MARRGHKCRCCQPPIDDACLGSCRPAGETRPLAAINVTLAASDYSLSFDAQTTNPFTSETSNYRFSYLFPGSLYAGTFSLTPLPSTPTTYEYLFPECGTGCRGRLRYITGATINNCRLVTFLPGVTEPNEWYPPDGNNDTPACGVSLPLDTGEAISLPQSCGNLNALALDGSKLALTQDLSTGGFILTGTRTLRSAVEDGAAYVRPCVVSAGNLTGIHGVVGGVGFSTVTRLGDITETGDPLVTVTNMTTTYA